MGGYIARQTRFAAVWLPSGALLTGASRVIGAEWARAGLLDDRNANPGAARRGRPRDRGPGRQGSGVVDLLVDLRNEGTAVHGELGGLVGAARLNGDPNLPGGLPRP